MFKDKNIIITGAIRGIGRATVEKIAQYGGNIWACSICYDESFENDMQELSEKYNVWIKSVYFDLKDEDQIKTAFKSIISEKKEIDSLINVAGVVYNGLFAMTPIEKLKEVFEINYFNQVLIMQLASRVMMRQKHGTIVNVASVSGIETTEGKLAYGSSKAALIYATKSISKELAKYNIRVNAIAPGLTNTDMNKTINTENLKKVLDRSSLGRMADPSEIAESIAFLASERSSFMTGQVMIVDGGRMWS